jgi:hypothetical protein
MKLINLSGSNPGDEANVIPVGVCELESSSPVNVIANVPVPLTRNLSPPK